jgi:DMSO reductase anchor subunit
MNFKNYSLVFFTLLIQMNTGMLFSYLLVTWLNANPFDSRLQLNDPLTVWLPFILVSVAMIFSFMHLGRPSNAGFAILNVRSSNLSREIFFVVTFTCILLVGLILFYLNFLNKTAFILIYGLAFLTGLTLIRVMVKLYRIPTVPPWNTFKTDLAFFNSILLLGSAAGLIIPEINLWDDINPATDNVKLLFVGLVLTGLFLHFLMDFYPFKHAHRGVSAFPVPKKPKSWLVIKYALLISGIGMIVVQMPGIRPASNELFYFLPAISLVFGGEIISRFLFYHSYYRVGV